MQPVSSSPPSVPDSRQNGLVDSCHRKRVSLTRNLDPAGPKSHMGESEKVVRESYTLLLPIAIRVSNERIIIRERHFLK